MHALHAKAGFQGSRLIVDASMDDAGVVAALVLCQLALLLQDSHFEGWMAQDNLPGRCGADDATTNDNQIIISEGIQNISANSLKN